MLNFAFAIFLIGVLLWTAKKLYFPTALAEKPDQIPSQPEAKASKKDLAVVLANLERWREEGRISREEYERLTDLCLSEMKQAGGKISH